MLLRTATDSFVQTLYTPGKSSLSPHGLNKTTLLFASTCDSGLRIGLVLLPSLLCHALEEHSRHCRFLLRLRREKDVYTKVGVLVRYFSMTLQAAAAAASWECFGAQSLESLRLQIFLLAALMLGKRHGRQHAELQFSNTHHR